MAAKVAIKHRIQPSLRDGDWGVLPPLIAKLYSGRGLKDASEIGRSMTELLTPVQMGGIQQAAEIIADAILTDQQITVAGDFDCDGATGTSVAVTCLQLLGAKHVGFALPNRFVHGYGLSPPLIDSMDPKPDLIITVDTGVSSLDGVNHANSLGIKVVVTDHHLPGDHLPDAAAIVNPNLKGDPFPSKMLAGVGVAFYVMLYVRALLRDRGHWGTGSVPDLAEAMDLVAIGTIADLVPLDKNNRILVKAGLERIRSGKSRPGVYALIEASKRDPQRLIASDVGFAIAPRLNAAGRMADMTVGVKTLIERDPEKAKELAAQLEAINTERKSKQAEMVEEAVVMTDIPEADNLKAVVVYSDKWHSGVVGLVASRLKDTLYRPTIAMARPTADADYITGSCRSIDGFHLRDALALVDARNPGLMIKFGGHAMAAGLSIKLVDFERFKTEFYKVAEELLNEDMLESVITVDGPLPEGALTVDTVQMIESYGPWGQLFPEPVFYNDFYIEDYRLLGSGVHLKLNLIDPRDGSRVEGIFFNGNDGREPRGMVSVAYQLSTNSWNGRTSVQLMIKHLKYKHEEQDD